MKKQILFIGNSYTYYHNMPEEIFMPMAATAGYPVKVTSVTHGGYRLQWFADPENEEGQRLREMIRGKHFDWVVLQDHSLITILDSDAFFEGIRGLKELLRDHADRFLLCATWGRKEGSETLADLNMSSESMTMQIADMYDEAARRFGMTVAHVGKTFVSYTSKNPLAELYLRDHHHPSLLGGSIAARTILASMTSATLNSLAN